MAYMGEGQIELNPNYGAIPGYNPNPGYGALNSLSSTGGGGSMDWLNSLIKYMPAASGGLGILGAIYGFIQMAQRNRQLKELQNFYKNWPQAANATLSQLVGDAASRGWGGNYGALAQLVAKAYAPYQMQAGEGIHSTIPPAPNIINPFDTFLKSLESVRSLGYKPTSSDTGINFNYGATRGGGGVGLDNLNRPNFIETSPQFNQIESMFGG